MPRIAGSKPCSQEVLAESEHVSIVRCSGGTIHLQMGPVTLSLTPAEFAEVAAVTVYAIERLQRAQPGGGPSSSRPH
jgi:hypothetical protein